MKPAALSASASRWISSISASTSSQPRSLCSARGGEQRGVPPWTPASPERGAGALSPVLLQQDSLTSPGGCWVFLLHQQVPGALGEEGQQQELQSCGDPGHPEEDGPACKETSVFHESWFRCHLSERPTLASSSPSGPHRAQPAALSHHPDRFSSGLEHKLRGDRAFVFLIPVSSAPRTVPDRERTL